MATRVEEPGRPGDPEELADDDGDGREEEEGDPDAARTRMLGN